MSKQKGRVEEEDGKRKDKSIPDTGQGSAGNLGSDGDTGNSNDKKSKQDKGRLGTIKRKPKTEA